MSRPLDVPVRSSGRSAGLSRRTRGMWRGTGIAESARDGPGKPRDDEDLGSTFASRWPPWPRCWSGARRWTRTAVKGRCAGAVADERVPSRGALRGRIQSTIFRDPRPIPVHSVSGVGRPSRACAASHTRRQTHAIRCRDGVVGSGLAVSRLCRGPGRRKKLRPKTSGRTRPSGSSSGPLPRGASRTTSRSGPEPPRRRASSGVRRRPASSRTSASLKTRWFGDDRPRSRVRSGRRARMAARVEATRAPARRSASVRRAGLRRRAVTPANDGGQLAIKKH